MIMLTHSLKMIFNPSRYTGLLLLQYNFTREENVDQSGKIKKNVTDLFGPALHKSVFLEMMKLAITIQNVSVF